MVESDHRPTLHEVKEKIRKNDFVLCGRPNWLEKNFQIVVSEPKSNKLIMSVYENSNGKKLDWLRRASSQNT
jgi:hypothetical protein